MLNVVAMLLLKLLFRTSAEITSLCISEVPSINFDELGITEIALHRRVHHVAVAAIDLHSVTRLPAWPTPMLSAWRWTLLDGRVSCCQPAMLPCISSIWPAQAWRPCQQCRKLIPWYEPIVLPNCFLVLAYSMVFSIAASATPSPCAPMPILRGRSSPGNNLIPLPSSPRRLATGTLHLQKSVLR